LGDAHAALGHNAAMRRTILRYLLAIGILVHIAAAAGYFLMPEAARGRTVSELFAKFQERYGDRRPAVVGAIGRTLGLFGLLEAPLAPASIPPFLSFDLWRAHGARPDREFELQRYDIYGNPVPAAVGRFDRDSFSSHLQVDTPQALQKALREAAPGTLISLAPGKYRFTGTRLSLGQAGRLEAPIYLRADRLGEVELELATLEGLYVDKPYWVFENLVIRGVCQNDGDCEHAFHVVGAGRATVIRNSRLIDFNAAIKVNALPSGDTLQAPDAGLVEYCTLKNSRARRTDNPVVPLNIDTADDWVVRRSIVADFAKAGGDRVSYGGYMKSNSRRGLFEQNLVVCAAQVTEGGVRVGLSFGGGGSAAAICRNRDCSTEHSAGTIRNNIIANCSDTGVYLNRAAEARVYSNLLSGTAGIDARHPTTTAVIVNNILDGAIRQRDDGLAFADSNLISDRCTRRDLIERGCDLAEWYVKPIAGDFRLDAGHKIVGQALGDDEVTDDFCGNPRPAHPDLGPVQYDKATCLPAP
jgi:hypothetical protein